MNQVIQTGTVTVGLQVRHRRNRELLAELLVEYHLVDVEDTVPETADLCIVDEPGFEHCRDALEAWKAEQSPTFAPVLLLATTDGGDPWSRYADWLGDSVDAILEIPLPQTAIRSRIEALLTTRRYARELATERELNRRIFDTSPIAKTVLDPDGTILRANQQAQDVLGLETSEIEGRTYDAAEWEMTDTDGQAIQPGELPFDHVIASGEAVYEEELIVKRPDGEDVWLSVNMAPIRDESGEIEYLVTAMDDITEERRLERQLRASEALHRMTLENITDTVVITDDAGRFTYVCPNSEHIFARTTEEVEALGDIEGLLGTDPAPSDLEEVGLVENIELEVTDAGGEVHVVLVTVKSVSIQDGSRLYSVRDITRRAMVEDELQETMESRSLALEAADAGVWEWDVEADSLTWDDSLEAVTGIELEPENGMEAALEELFHPDDVGEVVTTIERTLSSGETDGVTARVRAGGRDPTWLEIRGRPVVDGDGEVVRLIGVAIDVTERVERERELEQYEKIVETAPDPIYALDPAGTITLANEAFASAVGLPRAELVGSNIIDHLDPEDVEDSLDHIAALAAGEEPGTLEMTLGTADGPRRYEVNVALHGGSEDEDALGTVGVARDITELRDRERLLRRAQRAVDASGHAIYITDPSGTIVYANPAFERVTGYTPEEVVGKDPSILNSGLNHDAYYEQLWQTIADGELWEEEIVNERKDGERYHADQTIAPITDEAGEIEGYVGIQTDITEHKDRLQQLQVMDRVLRHNLHNALNLIMGHAELIQETSTDDIRRDAAVIIRTGRELLDLTDKQRAITKTISSEPETTELDLVDLVERLVDDVSRRHPTATIDLELPPEAPVIATRDLEKAVRELLVNAIEHAETTRPTVTVSVIHTPTAVELEIADDGPGIPDIERDIVTGEQAIEPLYHGSGLGLWLVAWIVRRSRGALRFDGNDPRGTVVTVTLEPAD